MTPKSWTRILLVAATLGLPWLAGCSSGESDVMGKSPPKLPTIPVPGGQHSGEVDAGAGSTTTGGRH